MKLAERTAALIDVVDRYEAEHCAALVNPARAESHALLRSALSEARRRVATAIAEERARFRSEVGAAEAALATERRLVAQHRAVQLLEQAWRELHTLIVRQWQDLAIRARWTDHHLQRALELLGTDGARWRIRFEPAWTAAEREAPRKLLEARRITVEFASAPDLTAGFVVECGHNVLDASLAGLLADRDAIEGRLLQLMQSEQAE